jgi:hypothetical protein
MSCNITLAVALTVISHCVIDICHSGFSFILTGRTIKVQVAKSSLYAYLSYYMELYMHAVCHVQCTTVHGMHMRVLKVFTHTIFEFHSYRDTQTYTVWDLTQFFRK